MQTNPSPETASAAVAAMNGNYHPSSFLKTATASSIRSAPSPRSSPRASEQHYHQLLETLLCNTTVAQYVELPLICVLGDTSCGKSSVLSNLSTVELPSAAQLTTRCPVLLQMSPGEEKKAEISIEWKSSKTPKADAFIHRTISENEWNQIPTAISQAQSCILEQMGRDISSDLIRVHVKGPELRPTTLLDLPGWVRAPGSSERDSLPQEIQAVMDEYIHSNSKRLVFLPIHPAGTDFHNSYSLSVVRQLDPTTNRTLPVLTKPDLIDPGAEQAVVDLLQGQHLQFLNGWHLILGRGQAAMERGLEEHVTAEQQYFDETEPWASVLDRSLLGTPELRKKLAHIQLRLLRETTPQIIRELRQRRTAATTKLEAMGTVHTSTFECRRYYQTLCQELIARLQATLKGKNLLISNIATAPTGVSWGSNGAVPPPPPPPPPLPASEEGSRPLTAAAQMHAACAEFMQAIREGSLATIRTVVEGAQVLVTTPRGSICGEVVHLGPDFACVDYVKFEDRESDVFFEFVNRPQTDSPTGSTEVLRDNDVWSDGAGNFYISRTGRVYDSLKRIPLSRIRTDPAWLQEKLVDNRTDDLPCFINTDMFQNIVQEFISEDWRPPCQTLLARTEAICGEAVLQSIRHNAIQAERHPALISLMERLIRQTTQELILRAQQQIESHLSMEEQHPYTQDETLLETIAQARHASLRRELSVALKMDEGQPRGVGVVYDTQALRDIMDGVFDRYSARAPEEYMAEEMELILESYGAIATRRVIDRTPMICWELVRSLATTVQETLWTVSDEQLMQCMKDSEEFLAENRALQQELTEVTKALSIIEGIY